MFRQEQRQPRRTSTGRGAVLLVAASIAVAAPLSFVSLPVASGVTKSAGTDVEALDRRKFLAAAGAGLLAAAASGPDAARADMTAERSGGISNNPSWQRPEADFNSEMKKMGNNVGRVINLQGLCMQAQPGGLTATLSPGRIIVYDVDQPCGEGKAFIHAVGRPNGFAPMKATDGPAIHRYTAAVFSEDEIMDAYLSKVGQCADMPKGGKDEIKWEIADAARGGKCD